jgi:N-acetylglucosamine kinase-like BadF-type ATPase
MHLIVDSGSTKTRWCLVNHLDIVQEINTQGINPYVTSEEIISNIINSEVVTKLIHKPSRIFYYGAGCSNSSNISLLKKCLRAINSEALIDVEHDLLAVARALCQKNMGIAVILGTGSNSCLYDGENILQNTPSLGYILGDEGSGTHIGKKFLSDLFYNLVPMHIAQLFVEQNNITIDTVLNKVYKEPSANAYMASFCKWLASHKHEEYIQQLIHTSFTDFVIKQLKPYGTNITNKVYSIGSIAHYFSDIWTSVLNENGYVAEHSEQDPIKGLIKYHADGKTN